MPFLSTASQWSAPDLTGSSSFLRAGTLAGLGLFLSSLLSLLQYPLIALASSGHADVVNLVCGCVILAMLPYCVWLNRRERREIEEEEIELAEFELNLDFDDADVYGETAFDLENIREAELEDSEEEYLEFQVQSPDNRRSALDASRANSKWSLGSRRTDSQKSLEIYVDMAASSRAQSPRLMGDRLDSQRSLGLRQKPSLDGAKPRPVLTEYRSQSSRSFENRRDLLTTYRMGSQSSLVDRRAGLDSHRSASQRSLGNRRRELEARAVADRPLGFRRDAFAVKTLSTNSLGYRKNGLAIRSQSNKSLDKYPCYDLTGLEFDI